GRRGSLARTVLLDLAAFLLLDRGLVAEADAARIPADLDDLEVVFLARFKRAGALERSRGCASNRAFVAATAVSDFRVVAESFNVVAEIHERAKHGDAGKFALHGVPDPVLPDPLIALVVYRLEAERNAALVRVDFENLRSNGLALLENFVRIVHAARPADIADVNESIETIFDFDERAKFNDVADFSGDDCAHRIFFRSKQPRIGL